MSEPMSQTPSHLNVIDGADRVRTIDLRYRTGHHDALVTEIERLAGQLVRRDLRLFNPVPVDTGGADDTDAAGLWFETAPASAFAKTDGGNDAPCGKAIRVQSLDGIIASPLKRLDALFIGLGCGIWRAGHVREMGDASRSGAVRIVTTSRTLPAAERLAQELRSEQDDVELVPTADFAERLASNQVRTETVIADVETVDTLAGFAIAGCRAQFMAATSVHSRHTVRHRPRRADRPVMEGPDAAAAIMAMVSALVAARQCRAASQLHNAFLATLEDNIHTEEIPLAMPYSRMVAGPEFVAEVRGRLGNAPSRLSIQAYGRTAAAERSPSQGVCLRVV
jgi:hypothetical protein